MANPHGDEKLITVRAGPVLLEGTVSIPEPPLGIVLFAHGSGSSRHSPRNRFVARALREACLGTFLIDLLTPAEEAAEATTGHLRFNIDLLGDRLVTITDWMLADADLRDLPMGYFGASTGAAAAFIAATQRPAAIRAIVSRGGRPDLAWSALPRVTAPALLIVGERDHAVLDLNREALEGLRVEKELAIIPGATHLFEEPGALEEVARLARDWFHRHFTDARLRPRQ